MNTESRTEKSVVEFFISNRVAPWRVRPVRNKQFRPAEYLVSLTRIISPTVHEPKSQGLRGGVSVFSAFSSGVVVTEQSTKVPGVRPLFDRLNMASLSSIYFLTAISEIGNSTPSLAKASL